MVPPFAAKVMNHICHPVNEKLPRGETAPSPPSMTSSVPSRSPGRVARALCTRDRQCKVNESQRRVNAFRLGSCVRVLKRDGGAMSGHGGWMQKMGRPRCH